LGDATDNIAATLVYARATTAKRRNDTADYARIATFEANEAALEAVIAEINAADGPPEGVPAKSITVLADRPAGRAVFIVRFDTEQDLRKGSETLDSMSPSTEDAPRLCGVVRDRARACGPRVRTVQMGTLRSFRVPSDG
jgi:hypothetical protein